MIQRIALFALLLISISLPAHSASLYVGHGGDFQTALYLAKPGDEIVLEAGVNFTGPFVLPEKTGNAEITIRSSLSQWIPTSVLPFYSWYMPKLLARRGTAVLTEGAAHHYRFVGIEMTPAWGTYASDIVQLGTSTETSVDQLPHDITFDRCYIHGDPVLGSHRGIAMNGANITVINSYISDFKSTNQDTQALASWNGPGPFLIENNYLEAAAENIIFGGADPSIPNLVPSDIQIKRNHFNKPAAWKKEHWVVKNLLQLKNAQRVVIDGNIFENSWVSEQNGFAIVLTPRNQDGNSPWSVIQDVQFTNNIVRHATSGINILGYDDNYTSRQTQRITIANNTFYDIESWFLLISDGTANVVAERNSVKSNQGLLLVGVTNGVHASDMHTGFVFRNNRSPFGLDGVVSDVAAGYPTLARYFVAPVFENNSVVTSGLTENSNCLAR